MALIRDSRFPGVVNDVLIEFGNGRYQDVVDRCIAAGIRLLFNFAPVKLTVPDGVHLVNADLSLELQRLAYYLRD